MKKIFFLFAISFVLFGCKQKYSDQLTKLLFSKKLPEDVGKKMKKQFKDAGKHPSRYIFHWEFYDGITAEGQNNVYIMPIRYSKDEEKYYRQAWGLSETDPKGAVAGYSSFVIQVGRNSDYYQFTQICPPPEPCPVEQ